MTDLPRYYMELSDNERDILAVPLDSMVEPRFDAELHTWVKW